MNSFGFSIHTYDLYSTGHLHDLYVNLTKRHCYVINLSLVFFVFVYPFVYLLFVCLSVCLLAGLLTIYEGDFGEMVWVKKD